MACSAALAVLDVIEGDRLLERVRTQSVAWHAALRQLVVDFPKHVTTVRGLGYLVGLQMTGDPTPYVGSLRERGLLAPPAGGNVLRLLPPLNASVAELDRSVQILREVFAAKA